jgi:Pro-Pro endopeptidase
MRKWFAGIVVVILSLVSITTSKASIDGIRLADFPNSSELSNTINNSIPSSVKQMVILPKQDFDQDEAAGIINRISILPDSLLTKINNQGITLKLFTGKLTDNPTASHLAGKTPRGYQSNTTWDDVPGIGGGQVVLVKIGASKKGKGHGSINLELHEMAHSIDHIIFNEISQKQKFHEIWEKEHNQLFPGKSYFLYPEEYFAETFAMFYLNNSTKTILQNKAPSTYNFIKNLH